jgi:hypothetical protein
MSEAVGGRLTAARECGRTWSDALTGRVPRGGGSGDPMLGFTVVLGWVSR